MGPYSSYSSQDVVPIRGKGTKSGTDRVPEEPRSAPPMRDRGKMITSTRFLSGCQYRRAVGRFSIQVPKRSVWILLIWPLLVFAYELFEFLCCSSSCHIIRIIFFGSNVVGPGGFTPGLSLRDLIWKEGTKKSTLIISILCPPLGSLFHQKI